MDFVNTTPLPAKLSIGRPLPSGSRPGLVLAKATFSFDPRGKSRLDDQDPAPLYDADRETPLGSLPRDNMPRNDPAFEVFLLGKAHAPGGRPARHVRVALTVGDTRRELDVFGDRSWLGHGPGAKLSAPAELSSMPITYERAFGGTADIEIDIDSPIEVNYPDNPIGVGFDLAPIAATMHEALNCPPGFPRFSPVRAVPNIQRAGQPPLAWHDSPEPEAWCALPLVSAIHDKRSYRVEGEGKSARAVMLPGKLHRAHPGWVLSQSPSLGSEILLQNLTPAGELVLRFPKLAVHFDYVLGDREGSRALLPRALVLLPEEQRFTVLYALPFEVDAPSGAERRARLRIMENN